MWHQPCQLCKYTTAVNIIAFDYFVFIWKMLESAMSFCTSENSAIQKLSIIIIIITLIILSIIILKNTL